MPELLGDVAGDPGVGGRRRGQHRDARRERGEHLPDAAVVGPEVVAPVGDAVRLVDDEQAGGLGQLGQHLVAERRVVQPLRADQQHVDLTRVDLRADGLPVLDVGGVDGGRADAGSLGRLDLVAHQREQRRDDHGRPGAEPAQQRGGDEVDRRLAPAGLLYDEHPALLHHERLDRSPLVVVQPGVVASDQGAQVLLGLVAGARGRGHGVLSTKPTRHVHRALSRWAPRWASVVPDRPPRLESRKGLHMSHKRRAVALGVLVLALCSGAARRRSSRTASSRSSTARPPARSTSTAVPPGCAATRAR